MGFSEVIASIRRFGHSRSRAVAVALGVTITALRLPLQDMLGGSSPYLLAWPGMMVAAYIGGFWPAIIVSALGLAIGQWTLTHGGHGAAGPAGIAIFAAFSLAFATAGGALKAGRARARADAARILELQSQLTNVARLNAVGEMAGSLAHELNQPLTAIANYLNASRHLLSQAPETWRASELVGKAADQAVRAGQIVARVRASVERGEISLQEVSFSELARDAVEAVVAGRSEDGTLTVRFDFDRTADHVMADRLQIQQVVVNLVRNAVEAMEGRPVCDLRIGSRAGAGGFVEAYVADNGPGLAPRVAERLFQPFVSGKAAGMGLGLSICRSIVEAHGGRLWADMGDEGGAAFHFTLRTAGAEATA